MRTRTLTKTEDSAVTTVQAPCFMGITVEIRQEILILATALHEICPKDLSSHYSFNRVRGNGTSTIQSLLLVNHRIRTEMLHVVQKRRRQVEKQLSLFIDIPNNDSGWRKFKKYRESFCCPIFPYEVFEFCDFKTYLNYRDWLVRHAEWLLRCTMGTSQMSESGKRVMQGPNQVTFTDITRSKNHASSNSDDRNPRPIMHPGLSYADIVKCGLSSTRSQNVCERNRRTRMEIGTDIHWP